MIDVEERAERIRAIVEGHGGRVLDRQGDVSRVEVPADVAPGLAALFGQGGFLAIFRRQTFVEGNPSRAFYIYDVRLLPHDAGMPAPSVAAITMPTPPFRAP